MYISIYIYIYIYIIYSCLCSTENVSEEVLGTLVDSTCLLLKSKAREIVQAALGLLKALICIFPDTMLAQFMHKMVSDLLVFPWQLDIRCPPNLVVLLFPISYQS